MMEDVETIEYIEILDCGVAETNGEGSKSFLNDGAFLEDAEMEFVEELEFMEEGNVSIEVLGFERGDLE